MSINIFLNIEVFGGKYSVIHKFLLQVQRKQIRLIIRQKTLHFLTTFFSQNYVGRTDIESTHSRDKLSICLHSIFVAYHFLNTNNPP